ncbi:MAG: CPBP family intramembrane metalloprotease [Planctomycetes bacterium]|nr:CPBP family intramembrane metalloprotease [Planctomycetota bacterium]
MPRSTAALALALLVPAPSLGVLIGMFWLPDSPRGTTLFAACKLWTLALPLAWLFFVERARFRIPRPALRPAALGLASGLLISAAIAAVYAAAGDALVDRALIAARIRAIGLDSPLAFAGGALYWILVNSVLEEIVWRWFCLRQCERLLPAPLAILGSAAFFTLHHVLALSVLLPPTAVAICSIGVFMGGAIWSLMVRRFGSLWPGYLSHAVVDLCIFGLGAWLAFGGTAA